MRAFSLFISIFFVGNVSAKVCMAKWFPQSTFKGDPYDTKVQSADECTSACTSNNDCVGVDFKFDGTTCQSFKLSSSTPLIMSFTPICNPEETKQLYLKMDVPESSGCGEKELIELWFSNATTTLPNGQKYSIKEIETEKYGTPNYQVTLA